MFVMCFLTPAAALEYPDVTRAGSAYLYNITGDTLIYTKNSDTLIYPGPTVKLMTAAIAIDLLGNALDREITIDRSMIRGVTGNNINLQNGEVITVGQLLNALIIGGSNDAANVLAIAAAGSVDAFIYIMNEKAAELGAAKTVYTNVTGVHNPDMVTTISDTAKVALYVHQYTVFKEIARLEYFIIPQTNKSRERKIYNRNYFIATNAEYKYKSNSIYGMNAGSTLEAGYCVTATAIHDNSDYLCIIMGAESDEDYIYSYVECANLLSWAYKNFSYKTVLSTSEVICEIPVKLSANLDYIAILPARKIDLYLPNDIDIESEVQFSYVLNKKELIAPVSEGEVVGVLTVLYDESVLGRIDLIIKTNVPRNMWLYVESVAVSIFTSRQFIGAVVAVAAIFVIYIFANAYIRGRRIKQNKRGKPR